MFFILGQKECYFQNLGIAYSIGVVAVLGVLG